MNGWLAICLTCRYSIALDPLPYSYTVLILGNLQQMKPNIFKEEIRLSENILFSTIVGNVSPFS